MIDHTQGVPTTPTKDILPSRVKAERERQRMSREQLGVKAGLSGSTVARIESTDHSPRYETILRIAAALGVDPGYLFTDDDVDNDGIAS